ncbi:hypothetical protein [Nocardioides pelophilus]|uniref:hypothetical protein n=1 Tax=Nocardioides pelophilus TaxID=2172019 RepID=UPI0016026BA4|nr:hypothetical protein [Nocardioides pelophilus]
MYDRYQPPNEPEPDDPAPSWETFEPDKPRRRGRLGNRNPYPTTSGSPRFTGPVPGSGFTRTITAVVGLMVVGGVVLGISTNGPGPHDKPPGWDECVAEEAQDIRESGGSLLQPEDFCAIRYPDYDWENDPSYVEDGSSP